MYMLFLFALQFISATISYAQSSPNLSELDVFDRCYAKMVREPTNRQDSLSIAVRNNQKTGAQACLELFDRAKLNSLSGNRYQLSTSATSSGSLILKTFHTLHRSWFQNKLTTNSYSNLTDHVVRDLEEPALYYTLGALSAEQNYKMALTTNFGLRGIRIRDLSPTLTRFQAQPFFKYSDGGFAYGPDATNGNFYTDFVIGYRDTNNTFQALHVPDSKLVPLGRLIGIEPASDIRVPALGDLDKSITYIKNQVVNNQIIKTRISPVTCIPAGSTIADRECLEMKNALTSIKNNQPVNPHFGGGVLGSFGFINANKNLVVEQIPWSEDIIYRRIGARIYEDLLCQQLPALDATDVYPLPTTQPADITPSPFSFRRQNACMTCHTSLDPTAELYRNIFTFTSANRSTAVQNVGLGLDMTLRLPAQTAALNYALKPPVGRLTYRTRLRSSNLKINLAVTDLNDLGVKISSQYEFYLCAAKRYYQYFTGVDVILNAPENNELKLKHQNLVKALATELQSTQSLKAMLKKLFESDIFKTRNYQTELLKAK